MRRRLCPHLPICRSASRVRGCRKTPRHASRISGRNTHITFYKGHDNVKLRFAIDSYSDPYNLSPDNIRVVYLCPLSKAVGVNGSLQSLGKTVALSLTISFSLSLSLSPSLVWIFICSDTREGAEFYWGYQTSIHQIAEWRGEDGRCARVACVRIYGFPFPSSPLSHLRRRHECGLTNL